MFIREVLALGAFPVRRKSTSGVFKYASVETFALSLGATWPASRMVKLRRLIRLGSVCFSSPASRWVREVLSSNGSRIPQCVRGGWLLSRFEPPQPLAGLGSSSDGATVKSYHRTARLQCG